MDRRKSIKSIILGSVAGGLAVNGCKPVSEESLIAPTVKVDEKHFGRTPLEKELIAELNAKTFFNPHELETIEVLCNLILPATATIGGALEAEVPEFIEFMSKDIPEYQPKLRGGLMWLDHKCNTDFGSEFKSSIETQQKEILDAIAYPDIKVPENKRPLEVQFFSLIRNLTLTGYYTSKIGIEDIGYKGNTPNIWDGVPQDVLEKHGVSYNEEWIAKCIDQSKRSDIAKWDENGNLLT
ncbi:gluconate 2-dehydrogenase subunit 3-like protein [Maribacter vaceletii]|uniref:Gluconate 2-dehydrogenase subunit 3-like protein n=1 Tax=Maribacter vaceletii TaxID=1206816 RepID=A0A495DTM8_9FLAO|nr:gluconate 2-dehydrogenase subunit 3 family protein [Maribacter vaceletii]RKR08005.1 gluconate 2-dehydrogenase subunit 3-like protein [Maribacter vaceletii]